ncbi:unnamed protein product [Strongylus vulgaris]|uniref:Uncharacterized protein n=1 Tax=Strongylus vulgaris TaxID=40348 RepID=A0A3P7KRC4_STRVU|nr:unnamed protein product [Strongylus vulgaris]
MQKPFVKRASKEKIKPTPISSGSLTAPSFPTELLFVPLAPTQVEEDLVTPRDKTPEKVARRHKRRDSAERTDSRKLLPYPEVKPPTLSEKRRHERELERDKREKIASGFYQSRSDEDDTLEKVSSLKEEFTERSRRPRTKRDRKLKNEKKDEKDSLVDAMNYPSPSPHSAPPPAPPPPPPHAQPPALPPQPT